MYDVHIEVESLVYIYVYVGSRTIFFPVGNSEFFTLPKGHNPNIKIPTKARMKITMNLVCVATREKEYCVKNLRVT